MEFFIKEDGGYLLQETGGRLIYRIFKRIYTGVSYILQ